MKNSRGWGDNKERKKGKEKLMNKMKGLKKGGLPPRNLENDFIEEALKSSTPIELLKHSFRCKSDNSYEFQRGDIMKALSGEKLPRTIDRLPENLVKTLVQKH
jgi:hypothetical protein